MKELTSDQLASLRRKTADNMPLRRLVAAKLRAKGYDVGALERPDATVAGTVESFLTGIPSGATYGVSDVVAGTGPVDESYKLDVPVLGEVDPAHFAGQMLGGAVTGGALYKLGARAVGAPLASKAVQWANAAGAGARGSQWAGRLGGLVGAALPEGVVGSLADAIRTDDLSAVKTSFPMWMTLGVGSQLLQPAVARKLNSLRGRVAKRYARWAEKGSLTSVERRKMALEVEQAERAVLEAQSAGQGASEPLMGTGDAARDRPFVPIEQRVVPKDVPLAENAATPRRPVADRPSEGGIENREPPPDLDELDKYVDGLEDEGRQVAAAQVDDHTGFGEVHGIPRHYWVTESGLSAPISEQAQLFERSLAKPNVVGVYKGIEVRPAATMEAPGKKGGRRIVAVLRRDEEVPYILYDRDAAATVYRRALQSGSAYIRSPLADVRAVPLSRFRTFEDWERFILEHELQHRTTTFDKWKLGHRLDGETGTRAEYENYMNRKALAALDAQDVADTSTGRAVTADDNPAVAAEPAAPTVLPDDVPEVSPASSFDETLDAKVGMSEQTAPQPGTAVHLVNKRTGQRITGTYQGSVAAGGHRVTTRGGSTRIYSADKFDVRGVPNEDASPFRIDANPGLTQEQRASVAESMDELRKLSTIDIDPDTLIPDGLEGAQADQYIEHLKEAVSRARRLHESDLIADLQAEVRGEARLAQHDVFSEKSPPPIETMTDIPLDADAKPLGFLYRLGLGSPASARYGLSGHPKAAQGVRFALDTMEGKQALHGEWMHKYDRVRELAGVPQFQLKEIPATVFARMTGGKTMRDAAVERLHALGDAIDTGDLSKISEDPKLVKAVGLYRELMDDVADALNLPRSMRLGEYLHHVFQGRAGDMRRGLLKTLLGEDESRWFEDAATQWAGDERQALEASIAALKERDPVLRAKAFKALYERKGAKGYTRNLDMVTRIYLRGASEKWFTDRIMPVSLSLLNQLDPKRPWRGAYAQYLEHLLGAPSDIRRALAQKFADWQTWQRTTDRVIRIVGGFDEKVDAGSVQAFLARLEKQVQTLDPITGERTGNLGRDPVGAVRARMALQLYDLRNALQNPNMSGPVATAIYRWMIVSKLGVNMAHGLFNLLQTVTNTYPFLKRGNTARALKRYMFSNVDRYGHVYGRKVADLLREGGVAEDVSKFEEFIALDASSAMRYVQEGSLWASRHSERFNRGVAFLGMYEQLRDEGVGHALALADAARFVTKTQFPFNRAGTPPMMRRPLLRLLFMFKSFTVHQTDFTATILGEAKDAVGEKGFTQALTDGDLNVAAKHLAAYLGLFSLGSLPLINQTNVQERSQPPIMDMTSDFGRSLDRYGVLGATVNAAAGPAGNVATDLAVGAEKTLAWLIDSITHHAAEATRDAASARMHLSRGASNVAMPTIVGRVARGETSDLLKLFGLRRRQIPAAAPPPVGPRLPGLPGLSAPGLR